MRVGAAAGRFSAACSAAVPASPVLRRGLVTPYRTSSSKHGAACNSVLVSGGDQLVRRVAGCRWSGGDETQALFSGKGLLKVK